MRARAFYVLAIALAGGIFVWSIFGMRDDSMEPVSNRLQFVMLVFKLAALAGRKLSGQGLGFAEFAVLYFISQAPEGNIGVTELAEQTSLTAVELRRLLTRLEKMGVIEQHARERGARGNFIALTHSGQALFASALVLAEMRCRQFLPAEQDRQIEHAVKLLNDLGTLA